MPSSMTAPLIDDNISLHSSPQTSPTPSSPTILVIGGGVTGLTAAWVLLDKGYHVTIASKEWASYTHEQRLTSQIAGALWEYPPAVCGQHTDAVSLHRSKRWCMVAYRVWDIIAADPDLAALSGVKMKKSTFFFPSPIEDDPKQLLKMREIERSGVRGFVRDKNLIRSQDINPKYQVTDAYEHLAPIIDTDRAMEWLMIHVQSKGAKLITETIYGDLFAQEEELLAHFNAHVIVNATGLASSELANDKTCYPLRGALLRVINDGTDFPKVENALAITADAAQDNQIVFIVPRNDNILLLGGIAQPRESRLDLKLDDPIIKRMRERCVDFLPKLKNARLDPQYPFAQGLRPARERNVRVERELRTKTVQVEGITHQQPSRIVHSYGQGGAGWTLSFGCAGDVAMLVDESLRDEPAKAMELHDLELEWSIDKKHITQVTRLSSYRENEGRSNVRRLENNTFGVRSRL
ncbi:hypothetical protein MMC14_008853 [Varicellaria rhodocarpa]|nr:hypothetical protein [Varicellaria rhodocarpa]